MKGGMSKMHVEVRVKTAQNEQFKVIIKGDDVLAWKDGQQLKFSIQDYNQIEESVRRILSILCKPQR